MNSLSGKMSLTLYITTVTGNLEVKKQQQKIQMILDAKKIKYEAVDVAASEDAKKKMRAIAGDDKALPPQICNGDTYCGNFEAFDNAVEAEELEEFLKLK